MYITILIRNYESQKTTETTSLMCWKKKSCQLKFHIQWKYPSPMMVECFSKQIYAKGIVSILIKEVLWTEKKCYHMENLIYINKKHQKW